jgi:hypothetical protein
MPDVLVFTVRHPFPNYEKGLEPICSFSLSTTNYLEEPCLTNLLNTFAIMKQSIKPATATKTFLPTLITPLNLSSGTNNHASP